MLENYGDILTAQEVMAILKIHKQLLYDLIQTNQLPAYRVGKKVWRFNKHSFIKYLNSQETQNVK